MFELMASLVLEVTDSVLDDSGSHRVKKKVGWEALVQSQEFSRVTFIFCSSEITQNVEITRQLAGHVLVLCLLW